MNECRRNCWIAGGLAGLAVLLALSVLGQMSLLAGLFLGLVTAGLLGALLVWVACEGRGGADENEALMQAGWAPEPFEPSRRVVAPGGLVVTEAPLDAPRADGLERTRPRESVTLAPTRAAEAALPPGTTLTDAPGASTTAAPGEGGTAPAPLAGAATPAAAAPLVEDSPRRLTGAAPEDAPPPSATIPEASEAPAPPPAETPAREVRPAGRAATDLDTGPDRVRTETAPPAPAGDEGADDLEAIRGVGPMLGRWLNDNGVTRYAQIAAWEDADINRFAGMMGPMGHRIRKEDWVGQARALAGGRAP